MLRKFVKAYVFGRLALTDNPLFSVAWPDRIGMEFSRPMDNSACRVGESRGIERHCIVCILDSSEGTAFAEIVSISQTACTAYILLNARHKSAFAQPSSEKRYCCKAKYRRSGLHFTLLSEFEDCGNRWAARISVPEL